MEARSVFINAPFDERYERLFVTLVGTLVFLGQTPRSVLEVGESGQGRLQRIFDLITDCRMSFHDLSRVGTPARFNMPFELGLACALRLRSPDQHDVVVMDAIAHRMDRTLSDYKGRDPLIHHNRCDNLVAGVLDVFSAGSLPDIADLRSSARTLRRTADSLKTKYKSKTVFRATIFRGVAAAATEIAVQRGYIAP